MLAELEAVKNVHVEPRGQGKIEGVLAEYYVSVRPLIIYYRVCDGSSVDV